ncbi:MAG: hydroxymethylglutaryl-CoA lyase [Anaeromyxobacter sp.]|nr:hydroxymethylglutaryl-CoA lyase [Anaeromyxobacter sp.]MBL0277891.1 hydroxymethylglutaryl-CoA lyase [Anaeromyxobacter sp.]
MAPRVTVYEVGPRDGLQNEAARVPTQDKLALIRSLAEAGLCRIEATSFVSPAWIPQLADAAEVVAGLPALPGVGFVALVPNATGLARLLAALERGGPGAPPVAAAVFLSSSETHNRKNLGRGVEESFAGLAEVVGPARARGLEVRGYVSTAFGCPYEGAQDPGRVAEVARRLLDLGCAQVSLGDTIGVGTPAEVRRVLRRLLPTVPAARLALHGHDTRGTALANVLAALEEGLTTFDAAVGGLGGCPYAPGASGNLATEDLVYLLHGLGLETGVDFQRLVAAGALAQRLVGRPLPGKALQAALSARRGA